MNRLNTLLSQNTANILNIYFTAGYPSLTDTTTVLQALQQTGKVHIVEIGMPYSDPIADGETIQNSSQKALDNGMSIPTLLDQLMNVRASGITMPIILMGYFNPIMQYGEERFLQVCQQIGIDGLIIPDLPISVYQEQYHALFQKYGIHNIFLITPQTTEDRIRQIDSISESFIYMVSSASTTGAKTNISSNQQEYFARINAMNLKNPRLIGFGISNKETFQSASKHANGAIIGSAFVNVLTQASNLKQEITDYINSVID
jgi:tryptophan synthase alpha chain